MGGWKKTKKSRAESVVINDFYTKTGAWEGAHQLLKLLTHLAVFVLVTRMNFSADPLFCSASRRQFPICRNGTLVPSFLYTDYRSTEPCSVEQRLRLTSATPLDSFFGLWYLGMCRGTSIFQLTETWKSGDTGVGWYVVQCIHLRVEVQFILWYEIFSYWVHIMHQPVPDLVENGCCGEPATRPLSP